MKHSSTRCFQYPTKTISRWLLRSSLAVLLGGALALPVDAGCPNGGGRGNCNGNGNGNRPTPPLKGSPSRLKVITAAEGNKISVGDKTYLIDGNAKIIVDGVAASVDAIQPGMRVLFSSSVLDRKTDTYKATRVTARTPATKDKDKDKDKDNG